MAALEEQHSQEEAGADLCTCMQLPHAPSGEGDADEDDAGPAPAEAEAEGEEKEVWVAMVVAPAVEDPVAPPGAAGKDAPADEGVAGPAPATAEEEPAAPGCDCDCSCEGCSCGGGNPGTPDPDAGAGAGLWKSDLSEKSPPPLGVAALRLVKDELDAGWSTGEEGVVAEWESTLSGDGRRDWLRPSKGRDSTLPPPPPLLELELAFAPGRGAPPGDPAPDAAAAVAAAAACCARPCSSLYRMSSFSMRVRKLAGMVCPAACKMDSTPANLASRSLLSAVAAVLLLPLPLPPPLPAKADEDEDAEALVAEEESKGVAAEEAGSPGTGERVDAARPSADTAGTGTGEETGKGRGKIALPCCRNELCEGEPAGSPPAPRLDWRWMPTSLPIFPASSCCCSHMSAAAASSALRLSTHS